jgi:gas vesicle protein
MPPKHRQPNAPRPKPAGNTYKALVDLPQSGTNATFNGRDGKVDGLDDNSIVHTSQHSSAAAASSPQSPNNDPLTMALDVMKDSFRTFGTMAENFMTAATQAIGNTDEMYHQTQDYVKKTCDDIHDLVIDNNDNTQRLITTLLEPLYNRLENIFQKMDIVLSENSELRIAYNTSKTETVALKAAVDTLTRKLDEHTAISAPPSPEITASSNTMEEMTMQLSVVQHDIQDVLVAVRNPPGKRKRRTSNQDTEPTTPTNRRPATNRP